MRCWRLVLVAWVGLTTGCAAAPDDDDSEGSTGALSSTAPRTSLACSASSASFALLHKNPSEHFDVTLEPSTAVVFASGAPSLTVADRDAHVFVDRSGTFALANDTQTRRTYSFDVTQSAAQAHWTTRCERLRDGRELVDNIQPANGMCTAGRSYATPLGACTCTSDVMTSKGELGGGRGFGYTCLPAGSDCAAIADVEVRFACISAQPRR